MFTSLVIATLSATVLVDSLILYYPVYPKYVVPKHMQNFERNAPPRIFAADSNIPSSGIVFLKKNLQESLVNFQAQSDLEESNNRQRIHSDRGNILHQNLKAVSKDNNNIDNTEPSKNTPTRFYAIYDSKSKQYVTNNEIGSISEPYHDRTVHLISPEKDVNKFTDQLGTKSSIPFKSNQNLRSITSTIPETKVSSQYTSGRRIFLIDSDAIIKPSKFFALRR
ncbi:unnamed protein product [Cercopithifilaria johnstoni]|uniref:Uncharacterized protein n=1 Tax=Cercopithifilaria johnstoni TaxID=2874296 RepID=A0A8J2Q789_9BILA|nr:unnamed protein product [Cercopithifilaria johnstoni]